MSFSNKLQTLRKEKGFSQEALAHKIGITRSSIANYETGRNLPTTDVLNKLSQFFDCSTDYLLDKSDFHSPFLDDIGLSLKEYKALTPSQKEKLKAFIKALLTEI